MQERDAQHVLSQLFQEFAEFSPTLVGTFPLGLQVASSDLDVLCCVHDLAAFERRLARYLDGSGSVAFQSARVPTQPEASVTRFQWGGFAVEVFAQSVPIQRQAGFRHMVIEGRLLLLGGEGLRDKVRALKGAGLKTELAFARVLGLPGDPFAALLALESWSSDALEQRFGATWRDPDLGALEVRTHAGDREVLRASFAQADDSPQEIAGYIDAGVVLVVARGDALLGHLQLVPCGDEVWELKSMAVDPSLRGRGVGRRLVDAGAARVRELGARVLVVSTASSSLGQLRFYQRLGFRVLRIERDVFTVARGYSSGLEEDGIAVRDRVWLDMQLP